MEGPSTTRLDTGFLYTYSCVQPNADYCLYASVLKCIKNKPLSLELVKQTLRVMQFNILQ